MCRRAVSVTTLLRSGAGADPISGRGGRRPADYSAIDDAATVAPLALSAGGDAQGGVLTTE